MQTSCLFHAIKKRIVNKWPASQLLLEYSYFWVHFLVSLQHCLVASLHSFLAFFLFSSCVTQITFDPILDQAI